MLEFANRVKRSNNSDFASTPTWNQAVQIVEDFPAADVVEVRHGRWIVSATNLHFDSKCSACGETFYSPLRGAYIVHYAKYCPNCGAKMRRVQEDAE